MKEVSNFLNTEHIVKPETEKPCHELDWCPYGASVELFPLENEEYRCEIFGHDCPAYYLREEFSEGKKEELFDLISQSSEEESR